MTPEAVTALVALIVTEGDILVRGPNAHFWHYAENFYILLTGPNGYRHILCNSPKLDAQL